MAGGRSPIRPSNPSGCARPDAPTLRAPIGQPVASSCGGRHVARSGVAEPTTTPRSVQPTGPRKRPCPTRAMHPADQRIALTSRPRRQSRHEERNHRRIRGQRWPVGSRLEILGVCLSVCVRVRRARGQSRAHPTPLRFRRGLGPGGVLNAPTRLLGVDTCPPIPPLASPRLAAAGFLFPSRTRGQTPTRVVHLASQVFPPNSS